jgi:hypothetical protein
MLCCYLKDPKDCTRKLLDLITIFIKKQDTKSTFEKKTVSFLYIKYELTEKEIRKASPFTIVSKNV